MSTVKSAHLAQRSLAHDLVVLALLELLDGHDLICLLVAALHGALGVSGFNVLVVSGFDGVKGRRPAGRHHKRPRPLRPAPRICSCCTRAIETEWRGDRQR